MTRIAISGHRGLSPEVGAFIDQAIRAELARYAGSDLVGLSCLADGADQIFARAVIDRGGKLEVFVPTERYRDLLPKPAHRTYNELMVQAVAVYPMNHAAPTPESYMDVSLKMLKRAHMLFAVWDGMPARAFGGIADVVSHAWKVGMPVTMIWPEGARRG